MEERRLLSVAPIWLGAVYLENATELDEAGDLFEITFAGGAPRTQLTRLVIETDKEGDGLNSGDTFFDTADNDIGAFGAVPFQIISQVGIEQVDVSVVDGGTTLVLTFDGFEAGDKLIFSIDVDEQGFLSPNAVAEGNEFEGSILSGWFSAPHYYDASVSTRFFDYYDAALEASKLSLPPDSYVPPGQTARPVHTAGAFGSALQEPLPVEISGVVYEDSNLDGDRDDNEPGIAGVRLRLLQLREGEYAETGLETTTDVNGHFSFNDLAPGTYCIEEIQPVGWISTGANAGNVAGQVRGVASTPDKICEVVLEGGESSQNNAFGEVRPVSLSGHVYHDADNDGQLDPTEEGIPGVVLRVEYLGPLSWANVSQVALTDANGYWTAVELPPGQFRIVEEQPEGYLDGKDSVGSAGGVVEPGGDAISQVILQSGQSAENYNFGELKPASISGRVFADRNENCIPDDGDLPLGGVEVVLYDAQGNEIARQTTDENGVYSFEQLVPDTYTLQEIQPNGFFDACDTPGTAGGLPTGEDTITGINLTSGQRAKDYLFAELEPASLSGWVYADDNNNGLREASEQPLANVLVELYAESNNELIAATTTDAEGRFFFDMLRPGGSYRLVEQQPPGYFDGLDTPGSAGGIARSDRDHIEQIWLKPGQRAVDYLFGELRPASITGNVYVDANHNAHRDAEEQPISGVRIELLDRHGNIVASTTTDAFGQYRFENVRPGAYAILERQPAGYYDGEETLGSAGGQIADNDLFTGVKLTPGSVAYGYDFGELLPGKISGYVFQDGPTVWLLPGQSAPATSNQSDGVFDPTDVPISGVTLLLADQYGRPILDENGNPITAVTDSNGYYEFSNLPPGTYVIYEKQPEGYIDGSEHVGTLGGTVATVATLLPLEEAATLSLEPTWDAIAGIRIMSGNSGENYNFAELRVAVIPPFVPQPRPEFPPLPQPRFVPDIPEAASISIDSPVVTVATFDIPYTNGMIQGWTWHLSIINGGISRKPDTTVAKNENHLFYNVSWQNADLTDATLEIFDEMGGQYSETVLGSQEGIPVVGDFNGDGMAEVAVYVAGQWFIDLDGDGSWDFDDLWAQLGSEADQPVVGDWDGDGKADIGIFGPEWSGDAHALAFEVGLPDVDNRTDRPANIPPEPDQATDGLRFMKRSANGQLNANLIDHVFRFGLPEDLAVTGDWNGDGVDNIGIYRRGIWFLDMDGNGRWSPGDKIVTDFGRDGDIPVVGDWNGDGTTDLGIFRQGYFILDTNANMQLDSEDRRIETGNIRGVPIAGDFDADCKSEVALYRVNRAEDSEQLTQHPRKSDASSLR